MTNAAGEESAAWRLNPQHIVETAATAVSGALLAGAAGALVDLAVAAAIVGGANGAVSGARRYTPFARAQ